MSNSSTSNGSEKGAGASRWAPGKLPRALQVGLGFLAAGVGVLATIYGFSLLLRPDVITPLPPPDPVRLAEVTEARKLELHRDAPPRIQREVDYREGEAGAWWPKDEAPVLAELVREGKLPPVAERVGPEPLVLAGVDGEGVYGGTWQRLASSDGDVGNIQWRLSGSSLVRWSPEGEPVVPHLAKSWEISSDYREYTFHLRRGMRWSDGAPFTAADLEYWYEHEIKYFDVVPQVLRDGKDRGRLEKVDDYTVKFIFSEPNVLFLERLASAATLPEPLFADYCLPSHYLRRFHPKLGDQALIAQLMSELRLASPRALYQELKRFRNPHHPRLWPWVLSEATSSAPYVFVRNPYYFAVDPSGRQLPYLDRMVMEVRPSNLFGLTAAAGQVSMQERFIRYEDHVLLMNAAERNGYSVYHWYQAARSPFVISPVINRRHDSSRPDTVWKYQLLNDRRFRQALSLAINRQEIIDALFNGQTQPAQLDPGPSSPLHSEALFNSFTQFDPARANALLDELGVTQRDSEGFRTFPDGSRMVWYLNVTEYTNNDPAQFVVDDWAQVGVRCIQRVRSRLLFNAEKAGLEHDFTVWTGESEFTPLIEPRSFVPTYGEAFYAPSFGTWFSRGGMFGDPRSLLPGAEEPPIGHPIRRNMERLVEIYRTPDPARRAELFAEIQRTNAEEVWTISLCTPPPQLVVVKNGFRNVPRLAVTGLAFISPANAGLETYFWEKPDHSPVIYAALKRAVANVATPDKPALSARPEKQAASRQDPPGSRIGSAVKWLVLGALAVGLVLVAVRHPFIARRVAWMVPTLTVVSVVVFTIVQLPPGDFVNMKILEYEMLGTQAAEQAIADLRADFHLDEPMTKRYLRWVGLYWFTTFAPEDTGLLQGNLGLSMEQNRSVEQVVGDRVLLTVIVSLGTILLTWAVALPTGIYSAVRQYSPIDYGLTLVCFLGASIPGFLLAIVLMYLANHWFGLQISGLFSPEFSTMPGWNWAKLVDFMKHIWVPLIVLGVGGTASMVRIMRANLLDELKKPYVTTARAKGVRPLKLLLKYPVRMALNPFVSGLGALFPQLISGGAIVAMVLSLPMVGPVMVEALLGEDVYLAGSMLLILSLLGVLGTLVSDLLLLWLDPRIRFEGGRR